MVITTGGLVILIAVSYLGVNSVVQGAKKLVKKAKDKITAEREK